MEPSDEELLATAVEVLPQLVDQLERVERLLDKLPGRALSSLQHSDRATDGAADHEGHDRLRQAVSAARQAVEQLAELGEGRQAAYLPRAAIALWRTPSALALCVGGQPSPDDVADFVAELQRRDHRLLVAAELCGLLLGLSLRWAAASFAPPVVVLSLSEAAPALLALGHELAARPAS